MRIGLLASTGGMLDSFFTEIAEHWEASGHVVRAAAGEECTTMPGTIIDGLTRTPTLTARRAQRSLARWVADERIDVVVVNSATAAALMRTAGVRIPVVYFCHGLHWNQITTVADRVWQAVEHHLLKRTAAVITINSDDEAWFSRRMPAHLVLRVPGGVGLDLDTYPARALPSGPLSLVWIGEHSARKRPELAVELARELDRRGFNFKLTMVGAGDLLESTRELIRAAHVTHRARAIGFGDAAAALSNAHALVHTATWEGLPRVMLEAVATGRRTYAFDVKGVRDIPGAHLVDDGSVDQLADAIGADWLTGLLRHPDKVDRAALDYRHCADKVAEFIEPLTAQSAGAAQPARRAAQPARRVAQLARRVAQ